MPPPIVEAEPPPEPAPAVTLAHEISRYGVVTLSLSNRSEGSTRVALRVTVERDVEGESVAADDLGAFVVSGVADGSCAELVSGGELQNSWACLRGDASASDRTCTPAPNGTYRFVATSCDGRSRTEGEAFTYPP